jgi:hypothetical protein
VLPPRYVVVRIPLQAMGALGKRRILANVTAISCAVAIAGCGSSHKPNDAGVSASHSKGIQFANCMRTHGVQSFPDPSAGGGGINLEGTAINPQSPAFKSARQACASFAPGGIGGGLKATESQFRKGVKFAKCMRTHGYPDFPDPTRSDSPPGPIFIAGNGMFFRVSTSFDPTTPMARRALAGCARR